METSAPNPNLQPNNNPKLPEKTSKKLYLVIFVGISLILILLIYLLLVSSKGSPKTKNEQKIATKSSDKAKQQEIFEKVYVTAKEGLNLREEASTSSLITLLLPYATELKVVSTQGDWYFVQAQTKGFVSKEFVSNTKPEGIVLLTYENSLSPFKFLYPEVYKITIAKVDNTITFSFTGNESYGGFKVETTDNMATLGNYSLKNYPQAQKGSCEPIRFGTQAKECEKVVDDSGTTYLLLVNTTLYKITYIKTEGGLLTDLNNLVFYSMYFD